MAATFTDADVARIAALAHLELTPDEAREYARQLAAILEYAEQVQSVNTTGVVATAHVLATTGMERDDEPRPSLPADVAVANAPDGDPDAGLFKVPRVIG